MSGPARAGNERPHPTPAPIQTPEQFAEHFAISRETLEGLVTYAALLTRWQKAVNLVAPGTLENVWHRHFADSAQLLAHLPADVDSLVDLGAGAGFPGLVLALLLRDSGVRAQSAPATTVHLIESDQRKCAFLREVSRTLGVPVNILASRIENPETQSMVPPAAVITARALASLPQLLAWASPLARDGTVMIFPKGRTAADEVMAARKQFEAEFQLVPSVTEREASVVIARNVRPAQGATP